VAAVTAAGLLVGNLGVGAVCLLTYRDEGDPLTVAVIQGNLSSGEKWGTDMSHKMEVYGTFTELAAGDGADVVVWPETAFPYDMDEYPSMQAFFCELADEQNVTLLAGVFTRKDGNPRVLYNSVVAIDPDGRMDDTGYHKRNLVPFGEFVPWRDLIMTLIPPLADVGMLEEDLAIGQSANVFDDLAVGKIGSAICFDSIYESNMRESVLDGAELLAVSTNDSWFFDSAGVYMHNAQSQLRAIETGRYVVRSANTGISSIISPTGEVLDELEPLVEGYVIGDVYLRNNVTLYTLTDDVFVYLCMALCAAFVIAVPVERIVQKRK
jgi:apolipoprotein N-acyltransferase